MNLLPKQLTAPKRNIFHVNYHSSCSINVKEFNTTDNCINDAVDQTVNRNKKSIKETCIITAHHSFLNNTDNLKYISFPGEQKKLF